MKPTTRQSVEDIICSFLWTPVMRMVIGGSLMLLAACTATGPSDNDSLDRTQAKDGSSLEGTAWQLVQIMSMDDRIFEPGERGDYTITFESEDRVFVKADCNNAQGTWSFKEPSQLEFGVMAATLAICPPGSLHDRFMSDLSYVRSFVFEDGNLFLATMADGAILEFEPLSP